MRHFIWIFNLVRKYLFIRGFSRQRVNLQHWTKIMGGSRGGQGVRTPPPWKITKIKVSFAILVRIPLKSQSYQSSIQCWATIGPPAKRHLKSVSLAVRSWPANSGIWIRSLLIKLKKKNVVKVGSPLTKLSGSAHENGKKFQLIFNSNYTSPIMDSAECCFSAGFAF